MDSNALGSPSAVLEAIFGHEVGSSAFSLVFGFCLVTWVLVTRIWVSICSGRPSILGSFFGLTLSLSFGWAVGGVTVYFGVPYIEEEWSEVFLPVLGFGLGILLSVLLLLSRIFKLPGVVCLFIYSFATIAAAIAYLGTEFGLSMMEYGEQHIERGERSKEEAIDSLF